MITKNQVGSVDKQISFSKIAILHVLESLDIKPKSLSTYLPVFITGTYFSSCSPEEVKLYKESYQRLEFLGDSILSSVVAEYIYKKHPEYKEGASTFIHDILVKNTTLSEIALNLGLDVALHIESGMEFKRDAKVFADILEALVGAINLDKGITKTKEFVTKYIIQPNIQHSIKLYNNRLVNQTKQKEIKAISGKELDKVKSTLMNTIVNKYKSEPPVYKVTNQRSECGKTYISVAFIVNNKVLLEEEGTSKKDATKKIALYLYKNKDSMEEQIKNSLVIPKNRSLVVI